MCTGWLSPGDGFWYYLGENGDMLTGWDTAKPWKVVLSGTGRAYEDGWFNDNGSWYYLDGDGSMALNRTVDGWNIGQDGKAQDKVYRGRK